jgi:hypothetical protein
MMCLPPPSNKKKGEGNYILAKKIDWFRFGRELENKNFVGHVEIPPRSVLPKYWKYLAK